MKISNHPDAPSVERFVEILARVDMPTERRGSYTLRISHVKDGAPWYGIESPVINRTVETSDDKLVDSLTGARVYPDSEGATPEGAVGEYSFLAAFVPRNPESGEALALPLGQIHQILDEFLIQRMDESGVFDDFRSLV
ncbi:hypothetical protein [Arundinibacter roseus]|uniref:Uncharacterized protein n=1 Tax=Arundinibacter roseus TaxID=2070510 RepID=A0A4R4KGL1_9BACT|nr:hypothetical protein [Arundinibacter roseus]TDB66833.1 hypothetical protein EZE20_06825 [Arundinibacter roseus]